MNLESKIDVPNRFMVHHYAYEVTDILSMAIYISCEYMQTSPWGQTHLELSLGLHEVGKQNGCHQ